LSFVTVLDFLSVDFRAIAEKVLTNSFLEVSSEFGVEKEI
jgi:hypothetical protein